MKILAFTDSHGNTKVLRDMKKKVLKEKIKLVVCCGDFTIFEEQIRLILKKISEFPATVLILHGNHETASDLKKQCEKYENIIFLHEKHYQTNGILFLGYGGGGFSLTDPKFKKQAKQFKTWIKKYKKDLGKENLKVVLFTHAPPYGTELDVIMGEHCGNKSIRDFIKDVQPDLCLCGHLHENEGIKDKIGKTLIANPGPFSKIFDV